jgi:hypothetical protein
VRPGDLPVTQTAEIELVVNLKTVKALGSTMPQALRLRADELVPQGEPGTASVGKETKPALGCKRILHQAHAAAKAARTGWIC